MSRNMHVRHLMTVLLLLAAAGCSAARPKSHAGPVPLNCATPMTPYVRTTVYFDRSNTRDVFNPYSESEWERFINEVLIRFIPGGGSLFDNTGWWRRPNGTTFRGIGRTMLVSAPAPDSTPHRAGVDSVIAHIKQRYGHRLVIREEELICADYSVSDVRGR